MLAPAEAFHPTLGPQLLEADPDQVQSDSRTFSLQIADAEGSYRLFNRSSHTLCLGASRFGRMPDAFLKLTVGGLQDEEQENLRSVIMYFSLAGDWPFSDPNRLRRRNPAHRLTEIAQ